MMNNKPIETELDILLQAENLLANHKWYYMYEFMGSLMVALFPQKEYYLQHKEEYKELSFLLDKMEEWTFNVNFSAEGFEKWLLSFSATEQCKIYLSVLLAPSRAIFFL